MIRKKNKFSWPRKLYDKTRIQDENKLVEMYGLKNKREIWKADARAKYFRNRAKLLITAPKETQQLFFTKLNNMGFPVKNIAEVLALNKEDVLKRRLATIVWKKGLAHTARQARQMIVHRKVTVADSIIDIPSYVVSVSEEQVIQSRMKLINPKNPVVESTPEVAE